MTTSEELVKRILMETLKRTRLEKDGLGDILREFITFVWRLGDKVSGSLTDFWARFFGDPEYERHVAPVREDLEKLGELAREAWKMKGKWNEFLRKYVFEESGEVKGKFRRALEVLGVPWKEWKRIYKYVDNFFWVFPTDYIKFAQRYLNPETQRSWPPMDPEFFKSTVRTFEREQKRFIDEWWSRTVQIMTDVERIWSKVKEETKEGKEMIDLRKTVERVLLESLREIRLEKARKGRKKKTEPSPEVTEEKVEGKVPVLKVSDILEVTSQGGFIELKTVPRKVVQGEIVPIIRSGGDELTEGKVLEISKILSEEGKNYSDTIQFYWKKMGTPYGIETVSPTEQVELYMSQYNGIKDLPLIYSDGSIDMENLGKLREFVEQLLGGPLSHSARRDLYSEIAFGLRTLLASLKAGRYSWYRRRMRKEYHEELEKGLVSWLIDLFKPGWDIQATLKFIRNFWEAFKRSYVSRDGFVEFLEEKGITLDQWNTIRNDFENALETCQNEVNSIIDQYRRKEITREEMRDEIKARLMVLLDQYNYLFRLASEAVDWFRKRGS